MKERFLLPWVPMWILPVLVVMAVGTVWLRLRIVRTTYAISQTDRMVQNLEVDREQQQLKVTALRSPRRLEGIARARYSLSQPNADQVIHMGPSGVITRAK